MEMSNLIQIGTDRDGEPIWLMMGAAPDDDGDIEIENDDEDEDEDEDEDNDEDEDEDDNESESGSGSKPKPAKKAPAKKVPAKAPQKRDPHSKGPNYDVVLANERAKRKQAEAQLKKLREANETEADKRTREATEAAAQKYKPVAVKAAARAALVEAKIKGDPGRGVKLMDLDAIDIDDDGETLGLDEQIAIIVAEFPEMFESDDDDEKPKPRKKPGNVNGAGRKPPERDGGKRLSSAEKIALAVERGEM